MTVDCFQSGYLTEALKSCLRKMKDEISKLTSRDMDRTSRDEWVDYFVSKYEVEPLVIQPEAMSIDFGEKTVKQYNSWARMIPDEPEYLDVPGIRATCKVPLLAIHGFSDSLQPLAPFDHSGLTGLLIQVMATLVTRASHTR